MEKHNKTDLQTECGVMEGPVKTLQSNGSRNSDVYAMFWSKTSTVAYWSSIYVNWVFTYFHHVN